MHSSRYGSEFAGKLWNYLQAVDYRVALSETEKNELFRLRYEAYLAENAIFPNSSKSLPDVYDEMDNCWNFGIHIGDELAGAIRVHVITPDQPYGPAIDFFPDIVKPMLDAGNVLVDPTRFVTSREAAINYPEIPYLVLRTACMAYDAFDADYCLASVRNEHRAFYRRVFRAEILCDPRPYPPLTVQLGLMRVNVSSFREQLFSRYPVFESSLTERRLLFSRPLDVDSAERQERMLELVS